MEPKQIKDIPNSIYTLYQKGLAASSKNNIEYAIKLLKAAIIKEPGFLEARKELRRLESMPRNNNFLKKTLSAVKINKSLKIAQMKAAIKSYKAAIVNIEEALSIEITPSGLSLLADIGRSTDSAFITLEATDLGVLLFPKNLDFLRNAAKTYRALGMGEKEVEVRKKITSLVPDNLKERMLLREASALETMEKGDWENKDKSYRDKLKSQDESGKLETKEKIIKTEIDAKELIEDYENILKENPENIKVLRELGDIYLKIGKYDKAIEKLEKLLSVRNTFDIAIDTKIERAKISKINLYMNKLKESNLDNDDLNVQIVKAENEIKSIKRQFALTRVEKYPNDMLLRFSLAKIFWENNELDDAIEQFQLAKNNLNKQTQSLLYLGKCFMKKGQYDIALDQFMKVINESRKTTEEEFDALYHLGLAYEKLDKADEAAKCFKKIYSTKSTYRDVAKILQKYY